MIKALAIDHICIPVRDLDQARRNYEQRLGREPALGGCLSYILPGA